MSMQEALRKMSLMPAQTLEGFVPQMRKNGRLQEGTDADIVVFDPETISDVGAYADLILVAGNPLEDLDLVADPDANFDLIMKDGKIYKNEL